jgi:hypothetical protein
VHKAVSGKKRYIIGKNRLGILLKLEIDTLRYITLMKASLVGTSMVLGYPIIL